LFIDSDIGLIPNNGGEYLHFVKAFRRIIEGRDVPESIIVKLNALLQYNNTYRAFAKKHAPDFVMMWFLNALLVIPGLDPNTAQRLFAAGYHTIDELRGADTLVLRNSAHIHDEMIEKIRRFFEGPAPPEQEETTASHLSPEASH
jgi:hypothetical protein